MAQSKLLNQGEVATVDLSRLKAKDSDETIKLVEALKSDGFFYADLANDASLGDIVQQEHDMYTVCDEYFEQPLEIKMKDFRADQPDSIDRGFKHCRTDESFEMSSDEMHHEEQALPPSMAETTAAINKFHSHCREVALTLLDRIADECRNPLKELHGPEMSSESGLKLISEPAIPHAIDVYENKHRDSGTLTLLFYDSWSLHIRRNEQPEEWAFIPPPPPGCVLVHGASTLDRLSDGRFPAPLHRVTQPQDGAAKRYFLSYFLRPGERKTAGLETVA